VYCDNNPIRNFDHTGKSWTKLIGPIIGTIGGLIKGITNECKYNLNDGIPSAFGRVILQGGIGLVKGLAAQEAIKAASGGVASIAGNHITSSLGVVAAGSIAGGAAGGLSNFLLGSFDNAIEQAMYTGKVDVGKAMADSATPLNTGLGTIGGLIGGGATALAVNSSQFGGILESSGNAAAGVISQIGNGYKALRTIAERAIAIINLNSQNNSSNYSANNHPGGQNIW
jgi:hypothetical protein